MPRSDRSESGFLVLADISGFTAFVTATELEHGAEVTGALLDGVMAALAPPFEIQELEGDAVFALASDDTEAADRALLDSFNRAFEAFSERQREISLDMTRYTGKYAHFDEVEYFVVSLDRFAGRREGVGPEMLVGLRSLLGDLALGADPRAEHDLRPVVAA